MAEHAQNTGPHPWVRGAAWSLGLSVAVVGALASAMYDHDRTVVSEKLNSLESRVNLFSCDDVEAKLYRAEDAIMGNVRDLARNLASAQIEVTVAKSHRAESEEWKRRIIKLEEQIEVIKHDASFRHDPFTGTEGKALGRIVADNYDRVRRLIRANLDKVRQLEVYLGRGRQG